MVQVTAVCIKLGSFITEWVKYIFYKNATINVENNPAFEIIKYIPYLTLSSELWHVYYECFVKNSLCYNENTLYIV